jgi:hypothetical protein
MEIFIKSIYGTKVAALFHNMIFMLDKLKGIPGIRCNARMKNY